MKIDPVKESLQSKMKLSSISLLQLQDGITECFVLTNRNFLQRRMGEETSTSDIDATTRELAAQVFAENNISASYSSIPDLRKACQVLDKQLGFESNPELSEHHQKIIERLFDLAS